MRLTALAAAMCIAIAHVCASVGHDAQPKTGGTDNDPLIQLEVDGLDAPNKRIKAILSSLA